MSSQRPCHRTVLPDKLIGSVHIGRIGSETSRSLCSNRTRTCPRTGPPSPTLWSGGKSSPTANPSWVITTGTGGGIGPTFEVGDVIVSRFVTFDCKREFKKLNGESFTCSTKTPSDRFTSAESLFATNAAMLPKDNTRPPKIVSARSAHTGILTTDFFGFDNTADTYGLEGKGDLSEMGDAVLGMVCQGTRYRCTQLCDRPQRLRSPDRFNGTHPRATDGSCRQHLQGIRPVEFDLQCHCLLGDRCCIVRDQRPPKLLTNSLEEVLGRPFNRT